MGRASPSTVPLFGRVLLDSERRIRESNRPDARVGTLLDGSSWFGEAALQLADTAETQGHAERAITDSIAGDHWLVTATRRPEQPGDIEVVSTLVNAAVNADRNAILCGVAHSVRNGAFAVSNIVNVIRIDRPSGAELDECLMRIQESVQTLSSLASGLSACLSQQTAPPSPTRLDDVIASLLARPRFKSLPVERWTRGLVVTLDEAVVADGVSAMLEGGALGLTVEDVPHASGAFASIAVTRRATLGEADVAALWDLAGGARFEVQVRLHLVRAVVLAAGGRVLAGRSGPDAVRMGMLLPVAVTR